MRSRPRSGSPKTRPAAFVKAHWRDVVADAKAHGEVFVTHHNRPEVVVLSLPRYDQLRHEAVANDQLETLRAEFDREMRRLHEPGAAEELRRAFGAEPEEFSRAYAAEAERP
jgi:prevent-host-death family protein